MWERLALVLLHMPQERLIERLIDSTYLLSQERIEATVGYFALSTLVITVAILLLAKLTLMCVALLEVLACLSTTVWHSIKFLWKQFILQLQFKRQSGARQTIASRIPGCEQVK